MPAKKKAPGLTGADLEYAKAERGRDAAAKGGLADAHDLYADDARHGTDAQFSARQAAHLTGLTEGEEDMQHIRAAVEQAGKDMDDTISRRTKRIRK